MKQVNWKPTSQRTGRDAAVSAPARTDVKKEGASTREKKETTARAASATKAKCPPSRSAADLKRPAAPAKATHSKNDGIPHDLHLVEVWISDTEMSRVVMSVADNGMFTLRKQYRRKDDPTWNYTRDGISLPFDRSLMVALSKGAKELANFMEGQ